MNTGFEHVVKTVMNVGKPLSLEAKILRYKKDILEFGAENYNLKTDSKIAH